MSSIFDSSRVSSDQHNDMNSNNFVDSDSINSTVPNTPDTQLSSFPLNEDGQRYSLAEMFDIWYKHEKELSDKSRTTLAREGEHFKSEFPNQILHLHLQSEELGSKKFNINSNNTNLGLDLDSGDLSKRLENLSTNDSASTDNWIASNNQAHSAFESGAGTPLNGHPTQPPGIDRLQQEQQYGAPPENFNWYYLDSSGAQQGPFDSNLMQQWYEAQYFNFELPVRKEHEAHFISLKEYCDSINNYIDPFKPAFTPPPPAVTQPFYGVNVSSGLNTPTLSSSMLLSNPMGNSSLFGPGGFMTDGFGQMNIPQQLQQQPPLQQQSSINGWGSNSPFQVQVPQPASPWSSHPVTNGRINSPFAQNFTSVGSQNVQPQGNNASHLSNTNDFHNSYGHEDEHHQMIASSVIGGILSDNEDDHTEQERKETSVDKHSSRETSIVKPLEAPKTENFAEEVVKSKTKRPSELSFKAVTTTTSTTKPVAPAKPQLAPWATKANTTTPKRTLKEIQLEAEQAKLKEESQLRIEETRKITSQLLAEEMEAAALVASKPTLPKTASWAGNTQSSATTPKKSLLEVQKEQEAKKAKEKSITLANTAASKATKISQSKLSFASTAAAAQSGLSDDGAWTVVSKAKLPVQTKPVVQSITNTVRTSSPAILRTISATSFPPAVAKPTAVSNSTTSRDEFLSWSRSSLSGLDKSVSKDDLLNMFFDLPINGSDTPVLIAEIFDSYTLSRGGSKFAAEFIKRRQIVESVSGYVFWSEAVKSTANKPEDDGWSSTTKNKRKSKKN